MKHICGFLVSAFSTTALGMPLSIGLAPNSGDLAEVEALTASATGSSALFYNPAGLASSRPDLRLVGVEATADARVLSQKAPSTGSRATADLQALIAAMNSSKPVSAGASVRALNFIMPYVGLQAFTLGELDAGQIDASNPNNLGAEALLRGGAIAGLAFAIGPVSFGYARYFVTDISVTQQLSRQQVTTYANQIKKNPAAANTIPYRKFTDIAYGNAQGDNFGALLQPFDENPSGLGVAVLNAGNAHYRGSLQGLEPAEKALKSKAAQFGLPIEVPQVRKQMVNAGLTLGVGGGKGDIFSARLSADYDDMGGKVVPSNRRFAASTSLGLVLPDPIAMASRLEIHAYNPASKKWEPTGFYVGVLGLEVLGGIRPNATSAYGARLVFHAGVKTLSFLKLGIEAFSEHSLISTQASRIGGSVDLALTFIF